jgi:hypothetical protein
MKELFHYRDIAFSDPGVIREIQEIKFREHLVYSSTYSPFYRETLRRAEIDSTQVTLDQLSELPFTEKSHIEKFNDDFCAVPFERFVDLVFSSGTTGQPTRMMYTEHDLLRLAYNEERSFSGCGVTAGDLVLLTCTMDRCFVAGLAYQPRCHSHPKWPNQPRKSRGDHHQDRPECYCRRTDFPQKIGAVPAEKSNRPGKDENIQAHLHWGAGAG